MALVNDENPEDGGTQGYLHLSIAIVGPRDTLKVKTSQLSVSQCLSVLPFIVSNQVPILVVWKIDFLFARLDRPFVGSMECPLKSFSFSK